MMASQTSPTSGLPLPGSSAPVKMPESMALAWPRTATFRLRRSSATFGVMQPAWVASGIQWGIDNSADIIVLPYFVTATGYDDAPYAAVSEKINLAISQGVAVIGSAGDEGHRRENSVSYPGRYGGVITVGAHDFEGKVTDISAVGGEVDCIAPGRDMLLSALGSFRRPQSTARLTQPDTSPASQPSYSSITTAELKASRLTPSRSSGARSSRRVLTPGTTTRNGATGRSGPWTTSSPSTERQTEPLPLPPFGRTTIR